MSLKLPGLIDPHVHLREPGATHKEDWDSGTAAALAGGFTAVLAMPNTQPPVTDAATLELALAAARRKARCDYAQFLGAGAGQPGETAAALAPRAAGLKMYLDQTYGPLRLDEMSLWHGALRALAARAAPVVAHAEGRTLAAVILMAALCDRPLHICARLPARRDPADPRGQGARPAGDLRGGPAPPLPQHRPTCPACGSGAARCARAWPRPPTARRCGTTWT